MQQIPSKCIKAKMGRHKVLHPLDNNFIQISLGTTRCNFPPQYQISKHLAIYWLNVRTQHWLGSVSHYSYKYEKITHYSYHKMKPTILSTEITNFQRGQQQKQKSDTWNLGISETPWTIFFTQTPHQLLW